MNHHGTENSTLFARGRKTTLVGAIVNATLALIKIIAGVVGNSYALIADGMESLLDLGGSAIIWGGLKIASVPPDSKHPYGHGKAEPLAALVVAIGLVVAAIVLAIMSIYEVVTPHHAPEPFTLIVLIAVIVTKELLFRFMFQTAQTMASTAVMTDAWHHRFDAITSAAAFIGISIALIMGEGYESADDWAALLACVIIGYNGFRLARFAMDEVMDAAPDLEMDGKVRAIAESVRDVFEVEKCRIRKSGLAYFVDLHLVVSGEISVRRGHEIAHEVKDAILHSGMKIQDVLVHVEPVEVRVRK